MKKSNILIAVFAVLAAVTSANAQAVKVDFDGKESKGMSLIELLNTVDSCQNDKIACSKPEAERVEPAAAVVSGEVKIKVTMVAGATKKKETLLCQAGTEGKGLTGCKKQSDQTMLTVEEINAMSLRKYFPEAAGFSGLLEQTKHSYTNQSGPMTFHCIDICTAWRPVTSTNGCYAGIPAGAGCTTSVTSECVTWSHSCTCTKGC
ncbi:MAG: hypothetical protein Q7R35_18685 [Elusimicrobiota bacterium]|nr:hypothetical protein [Elusimicrobiota bacterium]